MSTDVFKARLAVQTDLIRKPDFDLKLKGISDRVTKNKTKYLLVENELKKLQNFDAAYFRGKSHFEEDDTQNYLVFQPMYRYFKRTADAGSGNYIYFWKSKGLSDERLDSIPASNYKITSELNFYDFYDKVTYNHGAIVIIYIFYETSKNYNISSYPILGICLFGAVSLTKNC